MLPTVYYEPVTSYLDIFQILSMPNFQSFFVETIVLGQYWNDDFKTLVPEHSTATNSLTIPCPRMLHPSW